MPTPSNPSEFTKVCHLGTQPHSGPTFIHIKYDGRALSITGVEGPLLGGDARGACGQIIMHDWSFSTYAPGWDATSIAKLRTIWDEWHLNDMRPGCAHQQDWPTGDKVEVVTYKLTTPAYTLRNIVLEKAAHAFLTTTPLSLTPTERALGHLDNWHQPLYAPPDADSPLSGCYEVDKRETKKLGWLTPEEHPLGLLLKPCPTCGYKYGSAWLYEPVPADILTWLQSLPDTDIKPAWI